MSHDSVSTVHSRTTALRIVRGALDEQSRRSSIAWAAGPFARQIQQETARHGSLERFLTDTGAAKVVDARTLRRALDVSFFIGAAHAERQPRTPSTLVDIITSLSQSPTEADITCLDIVALGSMAVAVKWAEVHAAKLRARGQVIIAGIGQEQCDLSRLAKFVDGFVTRPRVPSPTTWRERTAPIVKTLRASENIDTLSVEELQGGISDEDFEETLAQAALPDAAPQKRD